MESIDITSVSSPQVGTVPQLLTVGLIARRFNSTIAKVQYVIKSRRIVPTARAGNMFVFDPAQVEKIRQALNAIAARH